MRLLLVCLVLNLLFSGCKKGENDPSMSLVSRKKRMEGDWRMSAGSASFTGANYSELYSLNGSDYNNYRTYTGGRPVIYIGKYSLSLKIDKKGTMTFSEVSPFGTLQGEAEWSFNQGTGDEKKKESISIKITNLTKGNNYSGFFNHGSVVMHYRLKELSKEKIVMYSSGLYFNADEFPVTYQLEYTFEQR